MKLCYRCIGAIAALFYMLTSTGCATFEPPAFQARVVTFQNWPQVHGQEGQEPLTYTFVHPADYDSLAHDAYSDLIRPVLDDIGLVETPPDTHPRYLVSFFMAASEKEYLVSVPVYRHFPDPFFDGYGPCCWPYRMYPYGMYPLYLGDRIVTENYLYARLTLIIRDSQNLSKQGTPRSVYETTVTTKSQDIPMMQLIPLMAQAAFNHFPAQSGSEQVVIIPLAAKRQ